MTRRTWLGFDVGGANIKLAKTTGYARQESFPLWKYPDRLAARLSQMVSAAPTSDSIVATMTGELADCFASKRLGVHAIVDALRQSSGGKNLLIYLTDGSMVSPDTAKERYRAAAASNWHALASFSSRFVGNGDAILVDIGSTTCDVIPISAGQVTAKGRTDTERLLQRELVYLGVERTPICAITSQAPYRGDQCAVARELFATSLDAHIVLENIPEDPERTDTADGKPATMHHSIVRLARCVCADLDEFDQFDAKQLAEHVMEASATLVRAAIDSVAEQQGFDEETPIILSGHGDFLLDRAKPNYAELIHLHSEIGENAARCAPAYAVAALAEEMDLG